MPKCIPCLSLGIKSLLKERVDEELHKTIDSVPTCPVGVILNFCPIDRREKRLREKRPRSAYQEYISQCMKSKPIKGKPFGAASQYMKECASGWKTKK